MLSKAVIILASLAVVSLASSNKRYFGGSGRPTAGHGGFNQGSGLGGFNQGAGLGGFNQGAGLGGFNNANGGFGQGLGVGSGVGLGAGVGASGFGSASGFGGASSSSSCRYWCRTPKGQAYCCEGGNEPVALPSVKPGQCPPVRPVCPPVRNFRPPTTCSNDSKCPGAEKCCYDTCLEHHTCKLPIYY